eukprot:1703595-Prymnesium_polylepis.1
MERDARAARPGTSGSLICHTTYLVRHTTYLIWHKRRLPSPPDVPHACAGTCAARVLRVCVPARVPPDVPRVCAAHVCRDAGNA